MRNTPMIREQQSWTPSELIYLFVDGEADDVQKHLLFTALANDAALQAEFSDALRIGAAIEEAKLEERPPQHVTAALFQKAGFGEAAAAKTPIGAAVITTAAGSGFASRLQRMAVPFFSALVGGIIALFFAPEILRLSEGEEASLAGAHNPAAQSAPEAAYSFRQPMPAASGAPGSVVYEGKEETGMTAAASGAANRSSSARSVRLGGAEENGNQALQASGNGKENPAAAIVAPERSADPAGFSADTAASAMRMVEPAAPPVQAIPETERTATSQERETDDQPLALLKSAAADIAASEGFHDPRFTLQARGMAQLELFPHRSLNTGEQTIFENIAVAGFYNISRNHSIGIEAGREYHPLYVPTTTGTVLGIAQPPASGGGNGNGGNIGIILNGAGPGVGGSGGALTGNAATGGGTRNAFPTVTDEEKTDEETIDQPTTTGYRLQPHATWFGLAYQFRTGSIDRLGMIRPFVQTMLGGTEIGPIAKGAVGISWTPDSRVSFNLGLEGTTLLYRNNGDWYSSRKLGLAYSAQVNF